MSSERPHSTPSRHTGIKRQLKIRKNSVNKKQKLNIEEKSSSDNDADYSDVSDEEIDWNKVEEVLDKTASKANLSACNVKSILHHILTDKRVIDYAQNLANKKEASDVVLQGAKLTRSKAKQMGQEPFPLKKKASILNIEFSDTSGDEYYPASDEEIDEEDVSQDELSQASEDESNDVPEFRRPSQPISLLESTMKDSHTHVSFEEKEKTPVKLPQFSFDDAIDSLTSPAVNVEISTTSSSESFMKQQGNTTEEIFTEVLDDNESEIVALRTRSRFPMPDIEVEEIEAMFKPPDLDDLNYSVEPVDNDPVDADPEDKIWKGWLCNLMQPITEELNDTTDDPNDEDFNYMEAVEENDQEQEVEVEELRNDKTTRVTQKELQEMFNDLLLDYENERDFHSQENLLYEFIDSQDSQPMEEMKTAPVESSCELSYDIYQQITAQMQQHVQLLTQIYLLAKPYDTDYKEEASICKQYIDELTLFNNKAKQISKQKNDKYNFSIYCTPGIEHASKIIKSLNGLKISLKIPKDKKNNEFPLSPAITNLIATNPYFSTYYELIPQRGAIIPCQANNQQNIAIRRMKFLDVEDNLLTLGYKHIHGKDRYEVISEYLLPTKTAKQIQTRVKNLCSKALKDTLNYQFFAHGKLSPIKFHVNIPRTISTTPLTHLPRTYWKDLKIPVWLHMKRQHHHTDLLCTEYQQNTNTTPIISTNFRQIQPALVPIQQSTNPIQPASIGNQTEQHLPQMQAKIPDSIVQGNGLQFLTQQNQIAMLNQSAMQNTAPGMPYSQIPYINIYQPIINIVQPNSNQSTNTPIIDPQSLQLLQQSLSAPLPFNLQLGNPPVVPFTTLTKKNKPKRKTKRKVTRSLNFFDNQNVNRTDGNTEIKSECIPETSSYKVVNKTLINDAITNITNINQVHIQPNNTTRTTESNISLSNTTTHKNVNISLRESISNNNSFLPNSEFMQDLPSINPNITAMTIISPSKPLHNLSFTDVKQVLQTPKKLCKIEVSTPSKTSNDVIDTHIELNTSAIKFSLLQTPKKKSKTSNCTPSKQHGYSNDNNYSMDDSFKKEDILSTPNCTPAKEMPHCYSNDNNDYGDDSYTDSPEMFQSFQDDGVIQDDREEEPILMTIETTGSDSKISSFSLAPSLSSLSKQLTTAQPSLPYVTSSSTLSEHNDARHQKELRETSSSIQTLSAEPNLISHNGLTESIAQLQSVNIHNNFLFNSNNITSSTVTNLLHKFIFPSISNSMTVPDHSASSNTQVVDSITNQIMSHIPTTNQSSSNILPTNQNSFNILPTNQNLLDINMTNLPTEHLVPLHNLSVLLKSHQQSSFSDLLSDQSDTDFLLQQHQQQKIQIPLETLNNEQVINNKQRIENIELTKIVYPSIDYEQQHSSLLSLTPTVVSSDFTTTRSRLVKETNAQVISPESISSTTQKLSPESSTLSSWHSELCSPPPVSESPSKLVVNKPEVNSVTRSDKSYTKPKEKKLSFSQQLMSEENTENLKPKRISKKRKVRSEKKFDYSERIKEKSQQFANIYFARVRKVLSNEPKLIDGFFKIMENPTSRLDAFYKVQDLLADYPELVNNFSGFLEQHEARHVGKYLQWLIYDSVIHFHLTCEEYFYERPGVYQKIMEKLVEVTNETNDSTQIVEAVRPLFKGNKKLLNKLIRLFPDLSPPPFKDEDFEVFDFGALITGSKEIDDFDEVPYIPNETDNTFHSVEYKNEHKTNDKTYYPGNKNSNTNIMAKKIKKLASKRKKNKSITIPQYTSDPCSCIDSQTDQGNISSDHAQTDQGNISSDHANESSDGNLLDITDHHSKIDIPDTNTENIFTIETAEGVNGHQLYDTAANKINNLGKADSITSHGNNSTSEAHTNSNPEQDISLANQNLFVNINEFVQNESSNVTIKPKEEAHGNQPIANNLIYDTHNALLDTNNDTHNAMLHTNIDTNNAMLQTNNDTHNALLHTNNDTHNALLHNNDTHNALLHNNDTHNALLRTENHTHNAVLHTNNRTHNAMLHTDNHTHNALLHTNNAADITSKEPSCISLQSNEIFNDKELSLSSNSFGNIFDKLNNENKSCLNNEKSIEKSNQSSSSNLSFPEMLFDATDKKDSSVEIINNSIKNIAEIPTFPIITNTTKGEVQISQSISNIDKLSISSANIVTAKSTVIAHEAVQNEENRKHNLSPSTGSIQSVDIDFKVIPNTSSIHNGSDSSLQIIDTSNSIQIIENPQVLNPPFNNILTQTISPETSENLNLVQNEYANVNTSLPSNVLINKENTKRLKIPLIQNSTPKVKIDKQNINALFSLEPSKPSAINNEPSLNVIDQSLTFGDLSLINQLTLTDTISAQVEQKLIKTKVNNFNDQSLHFSDLSLFNNISTAACNQTKVSNMTQETSNLTFPITLEEKLQTNQTSSTHTTPSVRATPKKIENTSDIFDPQSLTFADHTLLNTVQLSSKIHNKITINPDPSNVTFPMTLEERVHNDTSKFSDQSFSKTSTKSEDNKQAEVTFKSDFKKSLDENDPTQSEAHKQTENTFTGLFNKKRVEKTDLITIEEMTEEQFHKSDSKTTFPQQFTLQYLYNNGKKIDENIDMSNESGLTKELVLNAENKVSIIEIATDESQKNNISSINKIKIEENEDSNHKTYDKTVDVIESTKDVTNSKTFNSNDKAIITTTKTVFCDKSTSSSNKSAVKKTSRKKKRRLHKNEIITLEPYNEMTAEKFYNADSTEYSSDCSQQHFQLKSNNINQLDTQNSNINQSEIQNKTINQSNLENINESNVANIFSKLDTITSSINTQTIIAKQGSKDQIGVNPVITKENQTESTSNNNPTAGQPLLVSDNSQDSTDESMVYNITPQANITTQQSTDNSDSSTSDNSQSTSTDGTMSSSVSHKSTAATEWEEREDRIIVIHLKEHSGCKFACEQLKEELSNLRTLKQIRTRINEMLLNYSPSESESDEDS